MGLFSSSRKKKSSLKARVAKMERKLRKKQEVAALKAKAEKLRNALRK
jgi:BMFP domain-containing protein YqiC